MSPRGLSRLLLSLSILLVPFSAHAWDPQYLDAWDSDLVTDYFGTSIVVGDDQLMVGAPYTPAVYVFNNHYGHWEEHEWLAPGEGTTDEFFGYSLALDGDRLVIGAPGNPFDPSGVEGAVYVFERTGGTWAQTARLVPADSQLGAMFGYAVSIEGDRIAVGSPAADTAFGNDAGAVHLFEFDSVTDTWQETERLVSEDHGDLAGFGSGVVLDGGRLAVTLPAGGSSTESGRVLVFKKLSGTWDNVAELQASDCGCVTPVGEDVVLDGDKIIFATPFDHAPGDSAAEGRVHVFKYDGSHWQQTAMLQAPASDDEDIYRFGTQLAYDGKHLVVAPNEPAGKTYIGGRKTSGHWELRVTLDDDVYEYADAPARAINGKWVAIGDPRNEDSRVIVYKLEELACDDHEEANEDTPGHNDTGHDTGNEDVVDEGASNEEEATDDNADNEAGEQSSSGDDSGSGTASRSPSRGGGALGSLLTVMLMTGLARRRFRVGV